MAIFKLRVRLQLKYFSCRIILWQMYHTVYMNWWITSAHVIGDRHALLHSNKSFVSHLLQALNCIYFGATVIGKINNIVSSSATILYNLKMSHDLNHLRETWLHFRVSHNCTLLSFATPLLFIGSICSMWLDASRNI